MFASPRRKIASSLGGNKSNGNAVRTALLVGVLVFVLFAGVYLNSLNAILVAPPPAATNVRSAKFVATKQEAPTQDNTHETLVLTTSVGSIRIVLRPDLSPESVDYFRRIVDSGSCSPCNLYRAEKPGILQGIIKSSSVPLSATKGPCPAGSESVPNHCPAWDASCGCHGPVMTHGMVAFAAGVTGPDFFINGYVRPAQWWGTQHTVFGQVQDVTSFHVLQTIFDLPVKKQGDLTFLITPLHIDLSIDNGGGGAIESEGR